MQNIVIYFSSWSSFHLAMIASLIAGLSTGLGSIPVYFNSNISVKTQDALLGASAGVMLAATSFSLIVPAIAQAKLQYSLIYSMAILTGGILAGAYFIYICNYLIPHEHFFKETKSHHVKHVARIWLFILAITIHNFPEGLAVGVGFGANNINDAFALMIGISLQNIPEGLVVAIALVGLGYSKNYAVYIAFLTGLVETIGGVIGFTAAHIMSTLLPFILTFAAGAMLFVISHEVIPESHRKGYETQATAGVIIGFVIMLVLDVALS